MAIVRFFLYVLAGSLLCACTPLSDIPDAMPVNPRLTDTLFTSFDGTELPLRIWLPSGPPRAVFIALHGYNDYSAFISSSAPFFNDRGIGIYAYDQRGFGAAPHRGVWAGWETMCSDLHTIIRLVRNRHPHIPVYILGDSMGGAVTMAADTPDNPLPGDGVILTAPAVWSRKTMPWYQRWALAAAARVVPWMKVSPDGLDITPSDNKQMLQELGRDPMVARQSRIASLYGLSNLMDAAYAAAGRFNKKALFLYGARDEIIPAEPMADVFRTRLQQTGSEPQRFLFYENGYHMLLRDLQAEVVREDILFWLNTPAGAFPSVQSGAACEITGEGDIFRLSSPHPPR